MEVALCTGMNSFLRRIFGALTLDVATYEEIEADRGANVQAMAVVLMSAVAAGIGASGFGASGAVIPVVATIALIAWAAWALLTFEIGVRLLRVAETQSDVTELMRTIGFASAPGILRVLGIMPALAAPAFAISAVWMLAAMIVAVRQALDYRSTARAIAVCAIGWLLALLIVVAWGWTTPVLSAEGANPVAYRVVIARGAQTVYGSAVLVRRDQSAGHSTLYFVTSAALFRNDLASELARDGSIAIELGDGGRVAVRRQDVILPAGRLVSVAVLKAVTTAEPPAPPPLVLTVPDPGTAFVIDGFDTEGRRALTGSRVGRVATLMLVGAPGMAVSGCGGSAATTADGVFGYVATCEAAALPTVVPFAAVASWIAQHVPGGMALTNTPVTTGFDLRQRQLPGTLLTVSCGETRNGEITVPFTIKAAEMPVDAHATLDDRRGLVLGEVAVAGLDNQGVRLRFSLTAQPPVVNAPSMPCPAGRALVSVGLDLITRTSRTP